MQANEKEWYTEDYSFDQLQAQSMWHKLEHGYELLIKNPLESDDDTGPLEQVFKVLIPQK